ncbi:hypothetical protein Ciccas_005625 [Cichlidogyrus casuarinus]|uniref:Uncharacterized protein n=1 Tax=Cichlidogyrus casuarinus TaxID=1844966 RepID=A0ABD2Q838_9PLAT
MQIVGVDEKSGKVMVKFYEEKAKNVDLSKLKDAFRREFRLDYKTVGQIASKTGLHPQIVGRLSAFIDVRISTDAVPIPAQTATNPDAEFTTRTINGTIAVSTLEQEPDDDDQDEAFVPLVKVRSLSIF